MYIIRRNIKIENIFVRIFFVALILLYIFEDMFKKLKCILDCIHYCVDKGILKRIFSFLVHSLLHIHGRRKRTPTFSTEPPWLELIMETSVSTLCYWTIWICSTCIWVSAGRVVGWCNPSLTTAVFRFTSGDIALRFNLITSDIVLQFSFITSDIILQFSLMTSDISVQFSFMTSDIVLQFIYGIWYRVTIKFYGLWYHLKI